MEDFIKKHIAETYDVPEENILLSSRLHDDLGLDSIDHLEVVIACEREYGILIPDADQEKIRTISDLITAIEANS